METCKTCAGDGIVGAGEFPSQKAGPLSTCASCNGTGKVEVVSEEVIEATPEEVVEETVIEEVPETPTENQEVPAEETPEATEEPVE